MKTNPLSNYGEFQWFMSDMLNLVRVVFNRRGKLYALVGVLKFFNVNETIRKK